MTRIQRVLTVPTLGGYFFDDHNALQANAMSTPDRYLAEPTTPGFRRVREPAEALSIGLVLDNGQVAWGDCVSVEFGGKAGRFPLFRAGDGLTRVNEYLVPLLEGEDTSRFLLLLEEIDSITLPTEVEVQVPEHRAGDQISRRDLLTAPARMLRKNPPVNKETRQLPLHPALRYGVSQALFQAAALARNLTLTEVICQEWDLILPEGPVPIHAQCGGNRFDGADKMIARRISSLPHSLVDNVPEQLGRDSVHLLRYARWLKARINELAGSDYQPTIHLDVHGGLGALYGDNLGRILGTISALEKAVHPLPLRVECPVIMDSREEQIEIMKTLRDYMRFRKMKTAIVADEWANTLEDIQAFLDAGAADMIQVKMPDLGGIQDSIKAVLACRDAGISAFLGGSCAETDISARVTAHVALATRPEIVLAKPGMGIDEGISILNNEMARTLARLKYLSQ
jgi:methylaspartate ammonia-lyase